MLVLSQKQIGQIKQRVKEKGCYFMFIPSAKLCELVIQDNPNPHIKNIPAPFKEIFMTKRAIRMDGEMIIKYLEGTLDEGNTFILDHGEVRVIDDNFIIQREEKK